LNLSNAKLFLNTTIKSINLEYKIVDYDTKKFTTKYSIKTLSGAKEIYDAVIIAHPLEYSDLVLRQYKWVKRDRKFIQIYVSYVYGTLDKKYFNIQENEELPDCILTSSNSTTPFSLILLAERFNNGSNLYKIYSSSEQALNKLFLQIEKKSTKQWFAYPLLSPNTDYPPLIIDSNLFYLNSMESAFSLIEGQIITAKNVVNILKKNLNF